MTLAFVGLGSNLGDSLRILVHAKTQLAEHPAIEVTACSSVYRTAPLQAAGPDFLNAVVALRTSLSAHELLDVLQAIEATWDRQRPYRNAPRTLDLDLLLYGQAHINDSRLTVPHPRMHERAFVMRPLCEVEPAFCINADRLTDQRIAVVNEPGVFAAV